MVESGDDCKNYASEDKNQSTCSLRMGKEPQIEISNIDLSHYGGQIKYSFVLMLTSLTSLAMTSKFQKNICFKARAVGAINIKTKECKSGRHL